MQTYIGSSYFFGFISRISQVPDCQELYNEIKNAIVENPPLTLKEGGVFNDSYNQELDEVRRIAKKGKILF